VDVELPDRELLDATQHSFNRVAGVIQLAHTVTGIDTCNLTTRKPDCIDSELRIPLQCMHQIDDNRRLVVDLGTMTKYTEEIEILRDNDIPKEVTDAKYGQTTVSGNAIERVSQVTEMAKRMLAADKELRREVCTAAAGARSEQAFFARLAESGVAARKRYSTTSPGEVTGYAVGLPGHVTKDGGMVWYGGGKLAADLTLPQLRRRWAGPGQQPRPPSGTGLSAAVARAVLRNVVTQAAGQARDQAGFFAGLREARALVRLRFSQTCPGQVTGYAVGLPGHDGRDGGPVWYGDGTLAAGLTLPRLRSRRDLPRNTPERSGAFRFTAAERNAIFEHAARQAGAAAEHIRRAVRGDPAQAADAAWAAADILHVAAKATGSADLRRAADSYDRAARARYGRIPPATSTGHQLRAAARLIAMTGQVTGDSTLIAVALAANLAALAVAVTELRHAQQHAARAAAARAAASQLHSAWSQVRVPGPHQHQADDRESSQEMTAADLARGDFPVLPRLGRPVPSGPGRSRPRPARAPLPPRRAGRGH
jgi:hypothetical protein